MFKAQCIIQYRILQSTMFKCVSRATTECEMELFLIKDNGWKSHIFVSKSSILHFLVVLDTLLMLQYWWYMTYLTYFLFHFLPMKFTKKGTFFKPSLKKTNIRLVNPIWTSFIPCFFCTRNQSKSIGCHLYHRCGNLCSFQCGWPFFFSLGKRLLLL